MNGSERGVKEEQEEPRELEKGKSGSWGRLREELCGV